MSPSITKTKLMKNTELKAVQFVQEVLNVEPTRGQRDLLESVENGHKFPFVFVRGDRGTGTTFGLMLASLWVAARGYDVVFRAGGVQGGVRTVRDDLRRIVAPVGRQHLLRRIHVLKHSDAILGTAAVGLVVLDQAGVSEDADVEMFSKEHWGSVKVAASTDEGIWGRGHLDCVPKNLMAYVRVKRGDVAAERPDLFHPGASR